MKNERLHSNLRHNLGLDIVAALADPTVVEIMLNPDGKLWIEHLGSPMRFVDKIPAEKAGLILSLVASSLDTTITASNPIVEGELVLDGSRFEGMLPPIVSAPSFTIRKKASSVFTIEQYLKAGIITSSQQTVIADAIEAHKNILVVGGTGSGKTTLVNGLIDHLANVCQTDRLVILEDTSELQSTSPNAFFLRTSDHVNMQRLVKATMRLRPDRILVGEVRDSAALDLLKAWNTGHPGGVATVHANSVSGGLVRMEQLIAEASPAPMQMLIAEAVDLILFITRTPEAPGRKVTGIANLNGFNTTTNQYDLEYLS
jgi:type IV secretion system protein VirB11